jgi:hypothetical protein
MTNHYHLLIETPEPNLSLGMQILNGRYSQAFNFRHERKGHVFEDRFKAIVVEKEAYLLELSRYVVLNPVKAGIVRSAREWRWSNYRATAGEDERPDFLEVDWTLSRFGKERAKAREAYRRFVSEGRGAPSPMDDVVAQTFLGGEEFLTVMRGLLEKRELSAGIPKEQQLPRRIALKSVTEAVADEWGVSEEVLLSPWGREASEAKRVVVHLTRCMTGLSIVELAKCLGITAGRVSQLAKKIERSEDAKLLRRIARLKARLAGIQ